MRIKSFEARKVYGYLDFKFSLFSKLTFIHGINGSGKTTAVRAMMALLKPDLIWLGTTEFKSMKLSIQSDGSTIVISASREADMLTVSYQEGKQKAQDSKLPIQRIEYFQAKERDLPPDTDRFELFDEYPNSTPGNQAIDRIRALPVPLFLGLDRTTLATQNNDDFNRNRRVTIESRTQLDRSLRESEKLAREAYAGYRTERDRLALELRKQVTLALFKPKERNQTITLPSNAEDADRRITRMEQDVAESLTTLGFGSSDIRDHVTPYFKNLKKAEAELEKNFAKDPKTFSAADSEERLKIITNYVSLSAPLPFIENVISQFENFRKNEISISRHIHQYEKRINTFLQDSGKNIGFSQVGNLQLVLPSGEPGSLAFLSSGEKQIFVLLTQLAFNAAATSAKVLIIDEPELSLHLSWQDEFVDAVTESNPELQIILATHSPAIIGERGAASVSLNGPRL